MVELGTYDKEEADTLVNPKSLMTDPKQIDRGRRIQSTSTRKEA